jgi:hypothetical protein
VLAHRRGEHAGALDMLRPVIAETQRLGGSHAQHDVLKQVFLDCAVQRRPRRRCSARCSDLAARIIRRRSNARVGLCRSRADNSRTDDGFVCRRRPRSQNLFARRGMADRGDSRTV